MARANGTVWIPATLHGRSDSVLVTVGGSYRMTFVPFEGAAEIVAVHDRGQVGRPP